MKKSSFLSLIPVVVTTQLLNAAPAPKLVLVIHQGSEWQLQPAEKLTANGKPRLRRVQQVSMTPDLYKRSPQENIGIGLIRKHAAGYLVEKTTGGWVPVVPDGLAIKSPITADKAWSDAQFEVQADRSSKPVAFRASDVFAILSGDDPADAAVGMLSDESNFTGAGEKSSSDSFDERMTMLVGISATVKGPAVDRLKSMLASAMTSSIQHSSSGSGRYVALTQGLSYSTISAKAFASDAAQAKLRDTLTNKKASIDRRVAILNAFGAASEWDPLIDKYGDFEEYDEAFSELHALREKALKESEATHTAEGVRLESEKQYGPALTELRLAQLRNTSSPQLAALIEKVRLEDVEAVQKVVRPAETISGPARSQILQYLTLADRYMGDSKMSEAEGQIVSAEAIGAKYPPVVLSRAKLQRARHELTQALLTLDNYDKLAGTQEEKDAGYALRANINYERQSGRDNARRDAVKAEEEGDYPAALRAARAGLQMDPSDPELLYHAGFNAAITRDSKGAADAWQQYLTASQPLVAESKRRADVRELLPQLPATAAAAASAQGASPNWFSNRSDPSGLMYDPASLMPNLQIFRILGSKKDVTTFEWSNGRLLSVKTSSPVPAFQPVSIYFDYRADQKGVRRVGNEKFDDRDASLPKLTAEGAVGPGKGTYVELATDPAVDPITIQKLTGRQVATIVSGNAYFNPFVWDGIHVFLAEYDNTGHVKSAKAIRGAESGKILDFRWDGDRLTGISERGNTGYRRELHYTGNELTGETVTLQGRTGKISYKYTGGRLSEAECDEAACLDGRSHKAYFEVTR